jgi:hypothetical protein
VSRLRTAPAPARASWPDDHRFDPAPYGLDQPIYNGALLSYKGRWIQTVRTGGAGATATWIGELDSALRPLGPFRTISTPGSDKEDARLFAFRGGLYASFTDPVLPRVVVGVARLRDDLTVAATYYPGVPNPGVWEKNWGFFERGGALYFVYSIAPHVVYRVDLEAGMVAEVGRTGTAHGWNGLLRGGTPPLQVGDRYVALFHFGNPATTVGWYEFEAAPPFRVIRVGRKPVWQCQGGWCVRYPVSLVPHEGELFVSMGVDDRELHLVRWDYARRS